MPQVESFMKNANLQSEYWKTTIPTVFNPYGEFLPSYNGLWLEFGVKAGGSIVYPAVLHPRKKIHGFDSFQGLPDSEFAGNTPWKKGRHRVDINDERLTTLKKLLPNIELYKGWFNNSCSDFLQGTSEDVAFVHIGVLFLFSI